MSSKRLERFRSIDITVEHLSHPVTLVQAHVDPKHQDIVLNGYGIKKKHAKALRDWLTQAMRHSK